MNSIKKNEDPGFDLISKLKDQISSLESDLDKANKQIEILNSMLNNKTPAEAITSMTLLTQLTRAAASPQPTRTCSMCSIKNLMTFRQTSPLSLLTSPSLASPMYQL
jgi:hypothetical protein